MKNIKNMLMHALEIFRHLSIFKPEWKFIGKNYNVQDWKCFLYLIFTYSIEYLNSG